MDNQSPRFGAQDSQEPPFYGPGQWTYQVQSAMDPLQYPQSQQVMNVMGGPIYQEDVQIVEPPPPRTRKVKEKKVSRRGGGFTKEEDEVLCSAFANVSKDPTIGVNQTHGGYYKRMHDYYNTYKPEGCDRSQLAVQSRWLGIQRSLNKFCGFKAAVDRRNESGKNEQDRIDDAVKIYEATEPFQFMHCWRILKDEPKWNEKLLELNGTSKGTGDEGASQANSGPDNSVPPRPEGRDSAKKKRVTDASSSSSAVDVLQRIHDNREKCQQKEDEQMQLILARKDGKLNLQRELLDLKKQQHEENLIIRKQEAALLDLKKQQHEENLILRKQEAATVAMQAEAQLLSAEAAIMGVDIDKVAPHLKNYYIGMQKQIMERRGFA